MGHVGVSLPALLHHLVQVLVHLPPVVLGQTLHFLNTGPRCFQSLSQTCPAIHTSVQGEHLVRAGPRPQLPLRSRLLHELHLSQLLVIDHVHLVHIGQHLSWILGLCRGGSFLLPIKANSATSQVHEIPFFLGEL